jgi:hypothetical protein
MISSGYNIPMLRGTSRDLRVSLIPALALLLLTDIAFRRNYDRTWSASLCIKNYPAGVSINQAYSNAEHLQINTTVLSLVNPEECPANALPPAAIQARLEESFNSEVIGQGHLAYGSVDPIPGPTGRHSLLSSSIEDLTGVFLVQAFLTLFPNSTPGETRVAWLHCI